MEDFYQRSYPSPSVALASNTGMSANGAVDVVTAPPASGNTTDTRPFSSSGKLILGILIIGGLIYMLYYLANYNVRMYKRDDSNKE